MRCVFGRAFHLACDGNHHLKTLRPIPKGSGYSPATGSCLVAISPNKAVDSDTSPNKSSSFKVYKSTSSIQVATWLLQQHVCLGIYYMENTITVSKQSNLFVKAVYPQQMVKSGSLLIIMACFTIG